jgi:predicted CoA-binding protein
MAKLILSASERLDILNRYSHIAMVGLSSNPFRPSHFAAIYLRAEGYDVIPVNPREKEILGQTCYPSLTRLAEARPGVVEVVDIFRNPADVPPLVEEAIAIGAKVVWMQLGVINEPAAQRAIDAGPLYEDRACALLRRVEPDRPEHGRDQRQTVEATSIEGAGE